MIWRSVAVAVVRGRFLVKVAGGQVGQRTILWTESRPDGPRAPGVTELGSAPVRPAAVVARTDPPKSESGRACAEGRSGRLIDASRDPGQDASSAGSYE